MIKIFGESMEHKLEDIIAIFNQCFEEEYNTLSQNLGSSQI